MSEKFASADLTVGQLNAIVKKLGGHEQALKLLRGELSVSKLAGKWQEKNGVIYLSVTSDGTSGKEWIKRLEDKGIIVDYLAKKILGSKDFKATTGIITEIAVLRGILFQDDGRFIREIRREAINRKLEVPNAEIACLLCEKLTVEDLKEMAVHLIVTVHKFFKTHLGNPGLLTLVTSYDKSTTVLQTYATGAKTNYPDHLKRVSRGHSYAFVVS